MKNLWGAVFAVAVLLSCVAAAQIKHVSEPAGKTLDKALRQSMLIQADSKPFHVRLEIAQSKVASPEYRASVEETWVSANQWRRVVTASGVAQTTVVNSSGTHIVTTGEYYPLWLRNFVIALFTPVPNADEWNRSKEPLEHIEMPDGTHSNPCQHTEFNLGEAPVQQVNFANVCFKDGLLEMAQGPSYTMEFRDYQSFGRLKIARTLIDNPARGVELVGQVVALEPVEAADTKLFETPEGSSAKDPLVSARLETKDLLRLAGGAVPLKWPDPIPGSGMFTVWVSLDRSGIVREAHTLNTDNSGLASDMAAQLVGQHWKVATSQGEPVQVQGAIVVAYPASPAG